MNDSVFKITQLESRECKEQHGFAQGLAAELEGRSGVLFWEIPLALGPGGGRVSWPGTRTQLPAIKPQVVDAATSLARNTWHH